MLLKNNRRGRVATFVALLGLTMLMTFWGGLPVLANEPVETVSFSYATITWQSVEIRDETGDVLSGFFRADVSGVEDGLITGEAELQVGEESTMVFEFTRTRMMAGDDGRFENLELIGQATEPDRAGSVTITITIDPSQFDPMNAKTRVGNTGFGYGADDDITNLRSFEFDALGNIAFE